MELKDILDFAMRKGKYCMRAAYEINVYIKISIKKDMYSSEYDIPYKSMIVFCSKSFAS